MISMDFPRLSVAKKLWWGPLGSDELRPPDELPEREAAAVRVALERWRELRRQRVRWWFL